MSVYDNNEIWKIIAERDRLRYLVKLAYHEGYRDAERYHGVRSDLQRRDAEGISNDWYNSEANKALQEEEG